MYKNCIYLFQITLRSRKKKFVVKFYKKTKFGYQYLTFKWSVQTVFKSF